MYSFVFLDLKVGERVGQFDSYTLITSQISLKQVGKILQMLKVWNGFSTIWNCS